MNEQLKNGATQIGRIDNYVLAKWGDQFVTWFLDDQGYTHHGNYFDNKAQAVDNLVARVLKR